MNWNASTAARGYDEFERSEPHAGFMFLIRETSPSAVADQRYDQKGRIGGG
jgi:hypothetical protein